MQHKIILKREIILTYYDILRKDLCLLKSGSFKISSIENKCVFPLLKDYFSFEFRSFIK